jgi:pimeloyl-ACP methyl ester carboxylesterase
MLALEPRFKGALLLSGGMPAIRMPTPSEAIHYLPRITLPVLMLNGRYDDVIPEARQLAVFNRLGTPSAFKRRFVFEAGHAFLPRKEYLNQSLTWLDATLGTVNR